MLVEGDAVGGGAVPLGAAYGRVQQDHYGVTPVPAVETPLLQYTVRGSGVLDADIPIMQQQNDPVGRRTI